MGGLAPEVLYHRGDEVRLGGEVVVDGPHRNAAFGRHGTDIHL